MKKNLEKEIPTNSKKDSEINILKNSSTEIV